MHSDMDLDSILFSPFSDWYADCIGFSNLKLYVNTRLILAAVNHDCVYMI